MPGKGVRFSWWSAKRAGRCARVAVLVVAVAALGVVGAGSAQAQQLVNASDCFSGEAGREDVVGWAYNRDWYPRPIYLTCGDETKGVIHIDLSHPIAEDGSDDITFGKCFASVMAYGGDYPAAAGNQSLTLDLGDGREAIVVWDVASRRVLTLYTTGAVSNDWNACNPTFWARWGL